MWLKTYAADAYEAILPALAGADNPVATAIEDRQHLLLAYPGEGHLEDDDF